MAELIEGKVPKNILHEVAIYRHSRGIVGIAKFFGCIMTSHNKIILILSNAGKSLLKTLPTVSNDNFPLLVGFATQIAVTVQQLHFRGIAHGDLHRDNIMVDLTTKICTVIDFEKSYLCAKEHTPVQMEFYVEKDVRMFIYELFINPLSMRRSSLISSPLENCFFDAWKEDCGSLTRHHINHNLVLDYIELRKFLLNMVAILESSDVIWFEEVIPHLQALKKEINTE